MAPEVVRQLAWLSSPRQTRGRGAGPAEPAQRYSPHQGSGLQGPPGGSDTIRGQQGLQGTAGVIPPDGHIQEAASRAGAWPPRLAAGSPAAGQCPARFQPLNFSVRLGKGQVDARGDTQAGAQVWPPGSSDAAACRTTGRQRNGKLPRQILRPGGGAGSLGQGAGGAAASSCPPEEGAPKAAELPAVLTSGQGLLVMDSRQGTKSGAGAFQPGRTAYEQRAVILFLVEFLETSPPMCCQ